MKNAAPATRASPPRRARPTWRWLLYALVLFVLNYTLVSQFASTQTPQRVSIPYTLFDQQVQAGHVAAITASGDTIQGRFKQPVSYTSPGSSSAVQVTAFATVQPTFSEPTLLAQLMQQGIVVNVTSLDQTMPWWLNLLLRFGPSILLIAGFIWISNRASQASSGGLFGLARSRAKRYDEVQHQSNRITFDDVAGIDEAKGELVEIVDFSQRPKEVRAAGRRGTQRHIAGRAPGHRQDPARQGVYSGSNSEQEQTLNQILTAPERCSCRWRHS
jgi:cell division protease FtsH